MQVAPRTPIVEEDFRFYVSRLIPVPPNEALQQTLATRLTRTRSIYRRLVLEQFIAQRDAVRVLREVVNGTRAPFRVLDCAPLSAEERKKLILGLPKIIKKLRKGLAAVRLDPAKKSKVLQKNQTILEALSPKPTLIQNLYERLVQREEKVERLVSSQDPVRLRRLEALSLSSPIDFLQTLQNARLAHKNYSAAKNEICRRNLRLVISVARRFHNRGMPLLDLIQEGNTGLMNAVDRFDTSHGVRFSTYASHWIRQGITRSLEDHSRTIRLPSHLTQAYNRYRYQESRFRASKGRRPTTGEAVEIFGLPEKTVRNTLKAAENPISLNIALTHEEGASLFEMIPDEKQGSAQDTADEKILHQQLEKAMACLPSRDRTALGLRFGLFDGRTRSFQEIGEILKISGERSRQIVTRGVDTLRQRGGSSGLEDIWRQLGN